MTRTLADLQLPRPPAAPGGGRLDSRLYDLVEARVRRLFRSAYTGGRERLF